MIGVEYRSFANVSAAAGVDDPGPGVAAVWGDMDNDGEADLPKQSVVNVSQIFTIDKEQLREKIGQLSPTRVREILDGIQLVLEPRDIE